MTIFVHDGAVDVAAFANLLRLSDENIQPATVVGWRHSPQCTQEIRITRGISRVVRQIWDSSDAIIPRFLLYERRRERKEDGWLLALVGPEDADSIS